ncbi:amidase signature domain-containing protein [Neohortaea acidophila]|uniref:amidase n=1 Tax=Neohortaea acidophila TaxID=245834 RepID=A0A6A6Q0S2_9PEZI|nr:amidase signature domain-containing protein [Neohortaea acidophila]KAF2485586.1 amidase signature domain-containing protein [Neohortaea acidophila]
MSSNWQNLAKTKVDSVLNLIPKEWRIEKVPSVEEQPDVTGKYIHQFLSHQEIEITESDAVSIVAHTSSGKWKSVDVAKAFCHRAALAHQLVNCLHEIFFDQAIQSAEALDKYYAQHKAPIGPLHGLPVSLKDQFHVKDVETHMGYIGWIGTFQGQKGTGRERKFESEMVRELRNLGAVLYVKTSVPHTLMMGETVNNIIGYTQNPKNRHLSAGGSSGGEGALIGLRGSPVGFGTDIGGSIRIPSAFNGLFGIRPSTGRLPYQGMANTIEGQNTVLSVVGPLATTPDALKLVMQSLLSTKPWFYDPLVHEIPWRAQEENIFSHPLSFAVVRHDGRVAPTPPVARAIEKVVKMLEKRGHTVIEWKPTPSQDEINAICFKAFMFDGGNDCRDALDLADEPMAKCCLIPPRGPQATAMDINAVNVEKREAQKAYMDYWNSTAALTGTGRPVDAIISPLAPFPAARPDGYTYYGYSTWVNMLDYTSVIVPVTHADKHVDKKDANFKAVDEADQQTQNTYDPELYDGARVSVQLTGRRLQEEKMLALAKYVGENLHGRAHAL